MAEALGTNKPRTDRGTCDILQSLPMLHQLQVRPQLLLDGKGEQFTEKTAELRHVHTIKCKKDVVS